MLREKGNRETVSVLSGQSGYLRGDRRRRAGLSSAGADASVLPADRGLLRD